jgi:hypothetical protein
VTTQVVGPQIAYLLLTLYTHRVLDLVQSLLVMYIRALLLLGEILVNSGEVLNGLL